MNFLAITLLNLIGAGVVFKIEQARDKSAENKKGLLMGQWAYNLVLLLGVLGVLTSSPGSLFAFTVVPLELFIYLRY